MIAPCTVYALLLDIRAGRAVVLLIGWLHALFLKFISTSKLVKPFIPSACARDRGCSNRVRGSVSGPSQDAGDHIFTGWAIASRAHIPYSDV